MNISELKTKADQYTWTLIDHRVQGNLVFINEFLFKPRKVVKKLSRAIKLEGGSWFKFPTAKESFIQQDSEGRVSFLVNYAQGVMLSYQLTPTQKEEEL